MSQPTFSKGRKSRLVDWFPLAMRTDFVRAQDGQWVAVGFPLSLMPEVMDSILERREDDMCPSRVCHSCLGSGRTVEIAERATSVLWL